MDLSSVELITFDCYGTLIDWETGMLTALRALFPNHAQVSDEPLLVMYGEIEVTLEAGPYLSYRTVLARTAEEMGKRLGVQLSAGQCQQFAESLKRWPPFPDSVEGLKTLAKHYRLGIISNTDDDLFAASQKLLQAPFAMIVTAQQVQSYKPSLRNFEEAMKRGSVPKEKMLHVGQSIYHDIAPANTLGLKNIWVNRRFGKQGSGATVPGDARPGLEVRSLAELVKTLMPA
ncbi:MAG TPA: haloacid dehalogenase type II [Candidatus Angelobacter sp.]|jgi:2-haloacid dehalogenase|nr:haloacid dehalogenase type II [Candidatus Angelobacter sp.]